MELEPRSEGSDLVVSASHLKQVRTRAMGRVFGGVTSFADALELSQAWPWAKTAAAGVEAEVRQFAQPWAAAWTRAEARAWVEARGRDREVGRVGWFTGRARLARAEKTWELEAEALALAGVWAWATRVREEQQKGEKVPPMPSTLADSSTIRHTLTTLTRYGLAGELWHCSSETRDEYSCIINFISPITRLPFELLQQIFLISIDEAKSPPSAVMCVCKHWHTISTAIWASINLGTRTQLGAISRELDGNPLLLDVVVDTDSDRGDFTPSGHAFEAIFAAIEAIARWRCLVIKSFPARADLSEDAVNRHLRRCSNATLSRFTTFKVKSACEASPLLDGLLRILGTRAGPELTTVEINSPNVISFLVPDYSSIFHSVTVLALDTPGIPDPIDLLPHLHRLESFTAAHISFPIYHSDIHLPLVHTLHHLTLRAASIQWMSGRTFHVLRRCTIIFPLHHQTLHTFNITLPRCRYMTFQDYPLDTLGGFFAHELNHLSVTCSGSFNRRGNQQLTWLSSQVLGESRLAPRILHISIEATNQAWVNALGFMSSLEELVIHSTRPSSLGAQIFQSLVIPPAHDSDLGAQSTQGETGTVLCPLLRRFGLKYDRWLRSSERFDLISVFASVIQSRQHSNYALEGFDLWIWSGQGNPLELIKGSEINVKGFDRLLKIIEGKEAVEVAGNPFPIFL